MARNRMTIFALVASMALAAVGAAHAADLPSRQAPVSAQVPVAAPFSWSGVYVGVVSGYGTGKQGLSEASVGGSPVDISGIPDRDMDLKGATFGGTIGFNHQFASGLVLGAEADLNWADFKGSRVVGPATIDGKVDFFGTIRARAGYARGRFLPYVTGGLYWSNGQLGGSVPGFSITSKTEGEPGWVIGGGVEYALFDNWSVKAEYLYAKNELTFDYDVFGTNAQVKTSGHQDILRLGVTYRF